MMPVGASTGHAVEALLPAVLLQLIVIIAAARLGGWLFRYLGQPQVVGETAAGLLLGPSFFGHFFPGAFGNVFPPAADWPELTAAMRILSELGLVFLMFLIGQEFDFGHLRKLGRASVAVSAFGIIVPGCLGLALAQIMYSHVAADRDRLGFSLFMAVALSITAIPVLARIMLEFDITRTRIGVLTISAAAVDDVVGWTLLALVGAVVRGAADVGLVLRMVGLTLLFTGFVWFVVRPLLKRRLAYVLAAGHGELTIESLAMVLAVALGAAGVTHWIGIHSIFGPFVVGAALWDQEAFRGAVARRMRDFVFAFFLPIFFTFTGLRTNIGSLNTPTMWLFAGLVLAAAITGKVLGCGPAARLVGKLTWVESGCVAAMMNTRGLMELIVINVGRELGVIPEGVYCMLVLMAIATTLMTAPILRRLLPQIAEVRELHARRASAVPAA